jgi:hypothetical protein
MENTKLILIVNDKRHHLQQVLNSRSSLPKVEMKLSDVEPDSPVVRFRHDAAEEGFTFKAEQMAALWEAEPMFYKHEGKYHVLIGQSKVLDALEKKSPSIRGHLLSSPMLKKTREIVEVAEPINDDPVVAFVPNRIRFPEQREERRHQPRTPGVSSFGSVRPNNNNNKPRY